VILKGDMATLHRMAKVLLERETIERTEVELLAEGKELPPLTAMPAADKEEPTTPPSDEDSTASDQGPVLGSPPAEPAGA
jgi:hypothetical protein